MMKRVVTRIALLAMAGAAVVGLVACDNQLLQVVQDAVISARAGGVPTVIGTNPSADQTDVATSIVITATFEGTIDPVTLTTESFLLKKGAVELGGTVAYDETNNRASFTPTDALNVATTYTATLTTAVANTAGVAMASEHTWNFTTFDANPDEIVVSLSYGGPYEFNAQYPMVLAVVPHPWDFPTGGESAYEVKVNSPGSVVLNVADLPSAEAEDGTYWLYLIHDLSNDHVSFPYDGPSLSTEGAYTGAGGDNFTSNINDIIVTVDPYTVVADAQLAPGNAYSLTFTDTELVTPDVDEPNNDWRSAAPLATIASAYSRTMGWDDTDWYSFSPSVTDTYRIVVANNPYNPDDETSLDLGYPVQLSVMIYDSGTDSIYHINSDYDDAGTELDNYGLVDAYLMAGEPYLFSVTSTDKIDIGDYKIKIIPAEIDQDVDEPGNDDYVVSGGTEIPFGQTNYLERSLHKYDDDYFWIDNTGLNLSNVYFTVETVKPGSENQDLDVEISLLTDTDLDGVLAHYISNYDGGFADLYYNYWPEERREVRTRNQSSSTIDYYQPTGLYWIRFIYGPDYWDYDGVTDRPTAPGTTDDSIANTADMDNIASGAVAYHTIYRTDDVDYIRVWSGTYTWITVDLSVAETYTATGTNSDDFYADMDIFKPDESLWGANQSANGEGSPQIYVGTTQSQYYYVRVFKASNSPLETGAYKLEITGS